MFLRDKAYTNLPRKFNVTITGCLESCTHTESHGGQYHVVLIAVAYAF